MSDFSGYWARIARNVALRRALVSTVAGYIFSLILSAAITVLLALNFGPVRLLERTGIDFGMQIYARFQPSFDPSLAHPRHRYAFLDLDDEVCRDEPREILWTCPADEPAPPALVRELLRFASDSGAEVVIVDIAPPRAEADREALIRVASEGAGPLVIVPLVADPKGDRVNLFAPANPLIPQPFARGRLRLAPMVTQADPRIRDGIIRHYPAFVEVGERDLPTAPLVAAAWVAGPVDRMRIVCDDYGVGRADCGSAGATPSAMSGDGRLAPIAGSPAGDLSPVFWTLPQMRSAGYDRSSPFDMIFPYVPVSHGRTFDGGLTIAGDSFRGRIVVIGSSSYRARDLHATPLGVMSGPEILINATRSFLEFGRMRESRSSVDPREAVRVFRSKAETALLPALFLFPAWWFIHATRQRTARRRWPVRAGAAALSMGLFAILLGAGVLAELLHMVSTTRESALAGTPVDVITPIAALSLEIFADVAKSLLERIEHFINRGLSLISSIGRQIAGWLGGIRRWKG